MAGGGPHLLPLIDTKNSVRVVAIFANPMELDRVPPLLCQIFIWKDKASLISQLLERYFPQICGDAELDGENGRKGQQRGSPNNPSSGGSFFWIPTMSLSEPLTCHLQAIVILCCANETMVKSLRSMVPSASLTFSSCPDGLPQCWAKIYCLGQWETVVWGNRDCFYMLLALELNDLY